jgi:hypothetical protein
MTDTIDTDTMTALDRRAYVRQPDTDIHDLANLLFDFEHVVHAEPHGVGESWEEEWLTVTFDDEGWRDSEAVIDLCRCAGFEVKQVLFQRGEIRFEPEDA